LTFTPLPPPPLLLLLLPLPLPLPPPPPAPLPRRRLQTARPAPPHSRTWGRREGSKSKKGGGSAERPVQQVTWTADWRCSPLSGERGALPEAGRARRSRRRSAAHEDEAKKKPTKKKPTKTAERPVQQVTWTADSACSPLSRERGGLCLKQAEPSGGSALEGQEAAGGARGAFEDSAQADGALLGGGALPSMAG
jgi:hypothetical protein